ncbi:hypothetical protein [Planococcus sp. YIM B11945]|uniref:hypothetical protein n=1 Tax=Planococcus sp. YIM B11945 TaxID=3435410 RepID=UPI003D7D744D
MIYFVDQLKNRVHRRVFAGDAGGFSSILIKKREFTDSPASILQLEEKDFNRECPNFQSFQMFHSYFTKLERGFSYEL